MLGAVEAFASEIQLSVKLWKPLSSLLEGEERGWGMMREFAVTSPNP